MSSKKPTRKKLDTLNKAKQRNTLNNKRRFMRRNDKISPFAINSKKKIISK